MQGSNPLNVSSSNLQAKHVPQSRIAFPYFINFFAEMSWYPFAWTTTVASEREADKSILPPMEMFETDLQIFYDFL